MPAVVHDVDVDLCVVGGGIAGLCAAIAAARQGLKVALVHNRSVLGGNASSEIRQTIGGACFSGHYPDAREGGIVGDLWGRVRRRSFKNNPNDYAESSVLFLDACWHEPNLTLCLNTHVSEVERDGRRITAVAGVQMSTGRRLRFVAPHFADCTGDAHVACLGGAAFRTGQEGRAEFNESLAPEKPGTLTMGNTLLFQAEKLDRPVPFTPPDWAIDLQGRDIYWTLHPPKGPMESGSWVFEYGGRMDTIADAETIHAELLKILYSAWWDLKRRPECGMANHRLTFISSLPGKRESRRVIGDYTLNQNDIVETRRFPDDVAYAGWSLDLHNPDGFYGRDRPTTFYFFPEIHSVPLRCLYARDLDNLWLAGRDISVTHVALGGLRLMASCGIAGEAVGIAAAAAVRGGRTCRETADRDIRSIQQAILKQGGFIPGVRAEDPADLARQAVVEASSEAALDTGTPELFGPIGAGIGIAFPITAGRLDRLTLVVRNGTGKAVRLRGELRPIRTQRNFHPGTAAPLAEAAVVVEAGAAEAALAFGAAAPAPDLYMVHLFSDVPELELGQTRRRLTGTHTADHHPDGKPDAWAQQLGMPEPLRWVRRFNTQRGFEHDVWHPTPCFRVEPASQPYAAANVINGFNRPTRLPNLWASDPARPLPQELVLRWAAPVTLAEVRLVWDDDMDLSYPWVTPVSTLTADYTVEAVIGGDAIPLAAVRDNEARLCVHRFPPQRMEALRVRVSRVHAGGAQARLCEVRAYGPCGGV